MLINSLEILYLFDFDGTLVGLEEYKGFFASWKNAFRKGPFVNPSDFGIRWSILTGRPRIDKFLIWLCCSAKGLYPEHIFTHKKLTYAFKTDEEKFEWKLLFIKNILENKNVIERNISRVIYVDNDIKTLQYLNGKRSGLNFLAIDVQEFTKKTFCYIV